MKNLLKGNQKGVRYGNMVLERAEEGATRRRFVKIMLDGKRKTYKLFERQVRIASALHDDKDFHSPTLEVIKHSLKPPVPYAVFETREDGNGYGFMHDDPAFYGSCTEDHVRKLAKAIYAFHQAGFNIRKSTLKLTRQISSNVGFYKKEFRRLLDKEIMHRSTDGKETTKKVEELLVRYSGMQNIRSRLMNVLEEDFKEVKNSMTNNGCYLVHADMQIDNVYKHENGDFELLDFEWVGRSNNPVIAIMYDYGNLRARAWSSPSFQSLLDNAMLEAGMSAYPNSVEMIKAGMRLGVIRSSLMMSRYHLDVINTLKKDKRTEQDYFAMYPRSIAALVQELTRE
ncbi:MAG: hypothetical protein P4L61_03310 [Candidatus Pacebacteria bacterium]|nr:hypothetical protein [Candidatus Paceibacterota bacterium]